MGRPTEMAGVAGHGAARRDCASDDLGSLDLISLGTRLRSRACSPSDVACALLRRLDAYPDGTVWITRTEASSLAAQAEAVEKRRSAGEDLPLYGIPFAVKDNMDVAGLPTTAACPAFAYTPGHTAPAVARLMEAGALLVGKTNLDQFACGLAGDRSPYGACRNVFDASFISGGSSSGSAIAVAAGLVSFALGTDTAGSGRVPAGCNNVIGLKPTPGSVSTAGVVPSCGSLDCVSVMALTAEDARLVFNIAAGDKHDRLARRRPARRARDFRGVRFLLPSSDQLTFFGDHDQAALFRQAVEKLEALGGRRIDVDFEPFRQAGELLYEGPWLAERLAPVEEFLEQHPHDVHPVTRTIISGGARFRGVDVFRALKRLQGLRRACHAIFAPADVLLVPTFPTLPTRQAVESDSSGWSARLGYYTNFANLLRLAAVAVPAGFTAKGLPGGMTFLAPAGSDQYLCDLAAAWQGHSLLPLGATGHHLPRASSASKLGAQEDKRPADGWVRVAVAGAHLRGQPLHADLRRFGARFVRRCRTAARYRFVAFMDLQPPRPGLIRHTDGGGAIEVETYDLPYAGFGRLVASVLPPLAIGTVHLEDGEAVKGFLCEPVPGTDITRFGGWRAFRTHLAETASTRANLMEPPER